MSTPHLPTTSPGTLPCPCGNRSLDAFVVCDNTLCAYAIICLKCTNVISARVDDNWMCPTCREKPQKEVKTYEEEIREQMRRNEELNGEKSSEMRDEMEGNFTGGEDRRRYK